jgi:hypothetical protein
MSLLQAMRRELKQLKESEADTRRMEMKKIAQLKDTLLHSKYG